MALRFWDRPSLVNAILWGNYRTLRDAAQTEIESCRRDTSLRAAEAGLSVLHVSCVYGDFDAHLVENHLTASDALHIIDVAPQQLENVHRKLLERSSRAPPDQTSSSGVRNVHLWQQDASSLASVDGNSMDCVIVFFLLHEVPRRVRTRVLAEALRVVRPDTGRLVIVDYHGVSSRLNPFYYAMKLVLASLEPFALDLWRTPLRESLAEAARAGDGDGDGREEPSPPLPAPDTSTSAAVDVVHHETMFGGLYQKLVAKKRSKR
jgi:ubiquinone/menaquinone biosynthesis C-methylase UbiE